MIKNELNQPATPRVIFTFVMVVLGINSGLTCIALFICLGYFGASFNCIPLVVISELLFHIHFSARKGELLKKFNRTRMKAVLIIAVVVAVASLLTVIICSILAPIQQQGFQADIYFMTVIPSTVTILYAIVLAFDAQSCMRFFQQPEETVLPQM